MCVARTLAREMRDLAQSVARAREAARLAEEERTAARKARDNGREDESARADAPRLLKSALYEIERVAARGGTQMNFLLRNTVGTTVIAKELLVENLRSLGFSAAPSIHDWVDYPSVEISW